MAENPYTVALATTRPPKRSHNASRTQAALLLWDGRTRERVSRKRGASWRSDSRWKIVKYNVKSDTTVMVSQGATFGFGDEIAAAGDAMLDYLFSGGAWDGNDQSWRRELRQEPCIKSEPDAR